MWKFHLTDVYRHNNNIKRVNNAVVNYRKEKEIIDLLRLQTFNNVSHEQISKVLRLLEQTTAAGLHV